MWNWVPKISEVLLALDRESKNQSLGLKGHWALKYNRDHRKDREYLEKLATARELVAARQSSMSYNQPLMPTMSSSNRYRSRSPIDRHGNGNHQPQSSLGATSSTYSYNGRHSREDSYEYVPYDSDSDDESTASNRNFWMRKKKRPPTPINDNHIVNAQSDTDWNPNSYEPENNNAFDTPTPTPTPTPTSSISVGNSQESVQPFIMGTMKNIDNSCYMNSVLYILRMTPTLVHNIHHLVLNIYHYLDTGFNMPATENECLQSIATSAMVSNHEKWPNKIDINDQQRAVIGQLHEIFCKLTTMDITKDLTPIEKKEFQAAIRAINPDFTLGTQQDAHEFLLTILNCVRDCCATLTKLIPEHAGMFDK